LIILKKFLLGLIVGFLLATAVGATASQNIRLIVNGQEIQTDVPPQLIDGRVMVPARFVAEPLGATVKWDEKNNSVIITSKGAVSDINKVTEKELPESVKFEEATFQTNEGLKIKMLNYKYAQVFEPESEYLAKHLDGGVFPAEEGMQLFIFSINIKNITSKYIDVSQIRNLFSIIPNIDDGRRWDIRPIDIDYDQLEQYRYISPGKSLKINMVVSIP
jgi:hypothetical protein